MRSQSYYNSHKVINLEDLLDDLTVELLNFAIAGAQVRTLTLSWWNTTYSLVYGVSCCVHISSMGTKRCINSYCDIHVKCDQHAQIKGAQSQSSHVLWFNYRPIIIPWPLSTISSMTISFRRPECSTSPVLVRQQLNSVNYF